MPSISARAAPARRAGFGELVEGPGDLGAHRFGQIELEQRAILRCGPGAISAFPADRRERDPRPWIAGCERAGALEGDRRLVVVALVVAKDAEVVPRACILRHRGHRALVLRDRLGVLAP